jgi:F0F1-type ATP synthase alpha subunit
VQKGVAVMSNLEDEEFRAVFKNWAEDLENHQRQIFLETAALVEMLKQKQVSAKTKNEIIIILKGLQATVKSISKVLTKHVG